MGFVETWFALSFGVFWRVLHPTDDEYVQELHEYSTIRPPPVSVRKIRY